jgi:hypothetical protein
MLRQNPLHTPKPMSLRSILILSDLHFSLPSGLFPTRFPTKPCTLFSLFSHACHMPRPPHSSWLHLLMIFGNGYKPWSSSLCNVFHSPGISSRFCPNILIRTLFSNTLSLCPSLNVKDQVSRPYKKLANLWFVYFTRYIPRQQARRQNFSKIK